FKKAGLMVLAAGEQADLHLGVSPDGLRFVLFQGHPEYDAVSLLKEYRREVGRFIDGVRADYPPFPENYFSDRAQRLLVDFRRRATAALAAGRRDLPAFPEAGVLPCIDNTWTDTGKAIANNWLGLIYQLAHPQRGRGFMDGVDPRDPLGLRNQ
ncbi:MAG: homoserine O-succinyltransferase, partial [Gammaproteobacteria bacterium]|nr:homoserine O-succinyltransferase [Gammaproteobacteria bacterium]